MTKRKLVTIGIALGIFVSALDTTIIGTAMPTVVANLGGTELYSWVFAAYMLAGTTSTPIFGKLSDLFGQKRLFALAIGIFLLGSGLSGSAPTMTHLIVYRALQGIGAGGLTALAFTIVGHVFSPTERPKVQGMLGAMWAISSIVGPATGGFIIEHWTWRWIFYINLPIGIIPVALILANFQDVRRHGVRPAIDYVGAVSLSASIVALLFALLEAGTKGWSSLYILGLLGLSIVLLLVFIWNESKVPEPIVPLPLFRLRAFTASNVENLLTGAGLLGMTGFIPLYVQGVLGGSALSAGMALLPLSLGWPLGSVVGGQLVNRLGYRNMGLIGMAFLVAGFWLLTGMGVDGSSFIIGRNMIVAGLGMGLISPTITAAIQNVVPRSHMGVASSSVAFYRNIGGAVGVSAFGAILNSQMGGWASKLVGDSLQSLSNTFGARLDDPQVLLRPELSAQLPQSVVSALEAALANSLHTVFFVALAMLVFGLFVAVLLPNSTPANDIQEEEAMAWKR